MWPWKKPSKCINSCGHISYVWHLKVAVRGENKDKQGSITGSPKRSISHVLVIRSRVQLPNLQRDLSCFLVAALLFFWQQQGWGRSLCCLPANTCGCRRRCSVDVRPDKVTGVVKHSQTNSPPHTGGLRRMMKVTQSDHSSQSHYWRVGIMLTEDNPEDNLQQFQLLS